MRWPVYWSAATLKILCAIPAMELTSWVEEGAALGGEGRRAQAANARANISPSLRCTSVLPVLMTRGAGIAHTNY